MSEWLRLARVTEPSGPVISTAEAKKHLRIFHSDEDDYITSLVEAAEAFIEGPYGAGICLQPQTWRLSLDYFPCEITIPLGPVTDISSVTYTDTNGSPATVSSFRADYDQSPCRVWPARNTSWPAVTVEPGAVKVEFTVGFADTPADLKWAVRLLVSHLYEHREAAVDTGAKFGLLELPFGVEVILNRYRPARVA